MLDSHHHPLGEAAREWLREMQACVRAVDYERAFAIFAEDVAAFGTYAAIVSGRDNLQREQWGNVWPNIRDFAFRLDDVRCIGDEQALTLIAAWDSQGVRPGGSSFSRPGRATIVLQRRGGRMLAVHTHFSLVPAGS
jgi:ketosteroid isomerase-like protein